MSLWTLSSLLVRKTKAEIYQLGLDAAELAGLTTTSWDTGDPTRSLYHYLAAVLDALEDIAVSFISGVSLELAAERAAETGDDTWLRIAAYELSGYVPTDATYAETSCTLTNPGGGVYEIRAGDIIAQNSSTGALYHNEDGGTLAAGPATTLALTFVAEEPGSDSNAGANEIDTLITKLDDVTITNATAAVGIDAESPTAIVAGAREKKGIFSPNGPRDSYNYVAKRSELTGVTTITRSRSVGDSDTGDVALYVAGPSGAVGGSDVTAVQDAIAEWSTPLCITPTVQSANDVIVPVTYTIWLYESVNKTQAEVEEAIADALETLFATRPIGGDIIPPATTGKLYVSLVLSEIRNVFPAHVFRVTLALPAIDVALAVDEVAVLGAVTPNVNFVTPP